MDFAEQQRRPTGHLVGFALVVLMHGLLGWALVSGLARRVVDVVNAPVETKIIEEVKPPPAPPEKLPPPPPKVAPPPPAFVPPPEISVAPPPPAPTITATPMAPPPAPVVITPPAPPAPAPAPAAPVRTPPSLNFGNCEKPEYGAAARRAEAQGTTVVAFTMDVDGTIVEARVEKSAGPSREHKMLDRLTLEAVLRCRGRAGTVDGKPERLTSTVSYVWKIVD